MRFVKNEGLPVRLVHDDEHEDAAAVRLVPLQKKYHWPAFGMADKLGISRPKAAALRAHLGIDEDPDCIYTFMFGTQKHVRFSDNAFTRMRDALNGGVDMSAIWQAHGNGKRATPRPACKQKGCKAVPAGAS